MDLKRIIKIEPVNPVFHISWRLDLRCNFDCMYCPTTWHSLTEETKGLEQLQQSWNKIYSQKSSQLKQIQINFTGGEVTVNKDFLPFVKWIKENFKDVTHISVTTNGSASTRYYNELLQYVDSITFSVHSEFFNENKFFSNLLACAVQAVKLKRHIQVSIMNEPWHSERIAVYEQFLQKLKIDYQVKEIHWQHQTRAEPVTNKNKNTFDFGKYVK